jgi:hypothetical protein
MTIGPDDQLIFDHKILAGDVQSRMFKKIIDYHWLWLTTAIQKSWGISDFLSTAVGVFLPPFAKVVGITDATASNLAWQVPALAFCGFAGARLLSAPYLIYQKEHKRIGELEDELSSLRQAEKPALVGEITAVNCGHDDLEDGKPLRVIFHIELRNLGEQSIADRWAVYAVLKNGHRLECSLMRFSEVTIPNFPFWHGKPGPFDIKSEDWIYNKTQQPIPRNGIEIGFLCVTLKLEDTPSNRERISHLVVECCDVFGNRCSFQRAIPA